LRGWKYFESYHIGGSREQGAGSREQGEGSGSREQGAGRGERKQGGRGSSRSSRTSFSGSIADYTAIILGGSGQCYAFSEKAIAPRKARDIW